MQIDEDTIDKKTANKTNGQIKKRKNKIIEQIKDSRLYNTEDIDDTDNKEISPDDAEELKKNGFDIWGENLLFTEKYTENEFKTLKKWYELFDENNPSYFKIDKENKFLELQLLGKR